MIPEQQRLLETFTLLVANALERLTLTASEEQAPDGEANVNRSATPCWQRFHMITHAAYGAVRSGEILATLDLANEGSPTPAGPARFVSMC